jgi:hypothetical protein
MFKNFNRIKTSGRLLLRPYTLAASGRTAQATPSLLKSKLPQMFQDQRSIQTTPALSAMSALSTASSSILSEKSTPEVEQLLEVSVEECLEEPESNTGIFFQYLH